MDPMSKFSENLTRKAVATVFGIGAAAASTILSSPTRSKGPQIPPNIENAVNTAPPMMPEVASQLPPTTLQMESLYNELLSFEERKMRGPITAPPVSQLALQHPWADSYLTSQPQYNPESQWKEAQEIVRESSWANDYLETNRNLGTSADLKLQNNAQNLATRNEPELMATEFMKYVESLATSENNLAQDWASEYEFSTNTASDWAREYDTTAGKEEFWQKLESEWQKLALEDSQSIFSQQNQGYEFSPDNQFSNASDATSEGLKRLEAGDIPGAVLAFESSVQNNPADAEGWRLLGTAQAQNEQDTLAITALKESLKLSPNNLPALMALAASFTNETFQLQAATALKQWLSGNPKYASIPEFSLSPENQITQQVTSILAPGELESIQNSFMEAARLNPLGQIDPDVQSGLGILFTLGRDYDKAADCFRAALSVRPKDSLLWNRLGASLANGGREAEAISAYRSALEISPGFVRTRYNLGISCIHLNAYKEAAEHFLSALLQQSKSGKAQIMSDSIWSSLRMVFHLMNRGDLTHFVDTRDLSKLTKEFNLN